MEATKLNENSGLMDAIRHFSDPIICLEAVSKAKWPNGPECPRASKRLSFLKTRLMWTCLDAVSSSRSRSERSLRIPRRLDKWLSCDVDARNCKNGVSSYEIARASAGHPEDRLVHAAPHTLCAAPRNHRQDDRTGRSGRNFHRRQGAQHARWKGARRSSGDVARWEKLIVFGLLDARDGKVRTSVVGTRRRVNFSGRSRES